MGIITLLSDLGLQDASVASAKAILIQGMPEAEIIDISHQVEPYHLLQAAYLLTASYKNFPPGTCHVLLFDIFSEKHPRLILAAKDQQYFISPDNGLLSLSFGTTLEHVWKCIDFEPPLGFKDWLKEIASIIKKLQQNTPSDLGLETCQLQHAPQHYQPHILGNAMECQVIHIDRFENVVLNLTQQQFDTIGRGRGFYIAYMRGEQIQQLSTHYQHVRNGDVLCRFNSAGYMEIAINHGKAASLLGLRLHKEKDQIYNTIKIVFE